MGVKVIPEGIDENENKQVLFIDKFGKIRTGIVEYVKLIAQHNALDGVVTGTSTTAPTTHNYVLSYPLPFHSNAAGDDYVESTLSVTAAAGATASNTGSVTATFVATLRNQIIKILGDVLAIVSFYYVTDNASGTISVDSIYVEFGAIDTSTGNSRMISSKTISVGHSTTNAAVSESIAAIFGNVDDKLNEGERLYLKITINYTLTVDATGSTTAITATATVRLEHYRGTDDTCLLIPVVM